MLKQKWRQSKRYQEILNAFLKNGFSHILFRLGITNENARAADTREEMNLADIGVKLRKTLQDLGPTFIKLGQIASTRHDLVPAEIAAELAKLQDDVPPFPSKQAREIIEQELGGPIVELFVEFEDEPLAAASIGQVHVATLPSGERVAVKVQRPDIQPIVETDLSILEDVARFLDGSMDWAERYHLQDMIEEFSRTMRDELDYRIEGRNGERIAKQLSSRKHIRIPAVFWDYTTDIVLTTELLEGIKSNDVRKLEAEGYDPALIAERIIDSIFYQVLEMGFFHGDPHPGNISVLPGNTIVFMDFGMVGRLDDDLKYHFASLVLHMRKGDTAGMIDTLLEMGIIPDEVDMRSFKRDLDLLQTKYYEVPLNDIHLGTVFMDLYDVAYRHQIQIPNDITILGKTVITLEGLITALDSDFNIMKAVEPFGRKLVLERYNPAKLMRNSAKQWVENIEILTHLPEDLKAITNTIKKGKLRLDIDFKQTNVALRRLDQISNRLSFSIILLSFSILMVGLIIGSAIVGGHTALWRLPVIEIGSIIAGLMFIFLLFRIFRSGRM